MATIKDMKNKPNSAFLQFFGKKPRIRVLDFFLTYPKFSYSKSRVARLTGVSRITMDKIWDDLIKKKIIVKTGETKKGSLYKLNVYNPVVKALLEFDLELASLYNRSDDK